MLSGKISCVSTELNTKFQKGLALFSPEKHRFLFVLDKKTLKNQNNEHLFAFGFNPSLHFTNNKLYEEMLGQLIF